MVVGEPSAGKSAVMESITGLQFPVGIPTQFITQIIISRSEGRRVTLQLLGDARSKNDRWVYEGTTFRPNDLPKFIKTATDPIFADWEADKPRISSDMLIVSIEGPDL